MPRLLCPAFAILLLGLVFIRMMPAAATDPNSSFQDTHSKADIEKLITAAGKTPPDWWNATPLNIPPNIDLSWKNAQGAQGQKTIGAYLWNNINPNPGKWREGIKLVTHSLSLNKIDPQARLQATHSLAFMYTELLADYPRGAFWARKAGNMEVTLALCYAKMGCPTMAIAQLQQMNSDDTRHGSAIKLWAELGDMKTALAWADKMAKAGNPTAAWLAAGDACRRVGNIPEAIKFYQKVIAFQGAGTRDDPVNKKRASASLEAIKLFDSLDLTKIADGVYKANSPGYAGSVEVSVSIKNHRIEDVQVTSHHEKQFYGSLAEVPPQIVLKQSVKGIDMTSGATVTSEAIINATAKALSAAQQ